MILRVRTMVDEVHKMTVWLKSLTAPGANGTENTESRFLQLKVVAKYIDETTGQIRKGKEPIGQDPKTIYETIKPFAESVIALDDFVTKMVEPALPTHSQACFIRKAK
jgi:hypothetical protein